MLSKFLDEGMVKGSWMCVDMLVSFSLIHDGMRQ